MTLREFFQSIYCNERQLQIQSQRQMSMSINMFIEFMGADLRIDDLDHKQLNKWAAENPRGWAPKTIKRRLGDILSLWSYAYAIELTENQPNRMRIRKPRASRKIPDAWTLDQLREMLDASDRFVDYLPNGVRRCDLLRAIIIVGYHTVLRPSDLFRLNRDQLQPEGNPVPMEKRLGDEVLVRTPEYVIEFINRQYPDSVTRVFAWPYRREHFYAGLWKPMLCAAGLPATKRDCLQKLRRTGVSHGESIEPGYGALLAGHRPGSRVTYESYVDPRIVSAAQSNRLPRLF